MTWQEFQTEVATGPLSEMELERLGRLATFSLSADADIQDWRNLDDAKRRIFAEIESRKNRSDRQEEATFRNRDRQHSDRQHGEHVAQSSRMHVAQMERANFAFVFHRRLIWIATIIAISSALLAWYSLWTQRRETQRALDKIIERVEALEARPATS